MRVKTSTNSANLPIRLAARSMQYCIIRRSTASRSRNSICGKYSYGTSAPTGCFPDMSLKRALLLSCVLMAASNVAGAQAPPAPTTPPAQTAPPSPERAADCASMHLAPQSGTAATEGTTTGQRAELLSDRLARSDGVLCPPPGVDPEMHAPAPNTGKTPVIPPPGSPGGDPTIRPQ